MVNNSRKICVKHKGASYEGDFIIEGGQIAVTYDDQTRRETVLGTLRNPMLLARFILSNMIERAQREAARALVTNGESRASNN